MCETKHVSIFSVILTARLFLGLLGEKEKTDRSQALTKNGCKLANKGVPFGSTIKNSRVYQGINYV